MQQAQWDLFFDKLGEGVTVEVAAARIGYTSCWLYKLRKQNPDIAERWEKTLKVSRDIRADKLEAEAERRAYAGSDLLLMFMLKSLRPERFSDKHRTMPKLEEALRVEDIPGFEDLCNGLLEVLQPHPEVMTEVIAVLERVRADHAAKADARILN